MTELLGIDVGGSGIKGALVNAETGELASERIRVLTPGDFTIESVSKAIAKLVKKLKYKGPIGVGFPSAVANGIVLIPPTALHYPGWVGHSAQEAFAQATGCPVVVVNDADAAGMAEIRWGAGQGVQGTVMTFTLGTGVGCGMFYNGQLIPNFELGKVYLKGHSEVAELYMAGRIKREQGLTWRAYGSRLNEYFRYIEHLFTPDLIIVGGGVSKRGDKFLPYVHLERTRIVTAALMNDAGIIGAAAAAG
ncbi:MAG: ROK family protein [Chloroflexi bacterium]|nr:ROK family protein [Chloroflexota bacterium]